MTLFEVIILSVVEGITEFLPISSTGHLILASSVLGLTHTEFLKSFEIAIQCGAILSVVALYWKSFLDIEILKRIIVAFIPTAAIGLLGYTFVKTYLLGNELVVVAALALGGVALILFEFFHRNTEPTTASIKDISYKQACIVGLCQSVAIIPGVSRSAATIVGGLLLGIQRVSIVEFSFLLAVPTMIAATGLDLLKSSGSFTSEELWFLALGCIISFVVAYLSIRWLLMFVRTNTFIPFGIYRIVVAFLFFLVVFV